MAPDIEGRREGSEELDQRSNEWKIQEELRNVELEKELENRIRRRREESGDRDRWRDDERDREGKRHSDSRDERTREDRHREDWPRRERDRQSDRHEHHRETNRLSEGRQREDRHYDSDREYRSHRDDRYHAMRVKEHEEQGRTERARDQEHKERKSREKGSIHEADRRMRKKGYKDEPSEREKQFPPTSLADAVDGGRTEHRQKRARETISGEAHGADREQSRQRGSLGEQDANQVNDFIHDDRGSRRNKDDRETDGRLDRSRSSPRDHDIVRSKNKGSRRIEGQALDFSRELVSPQQETRASPSSNRMEYPSPPMLDDHRSPHYQRSMSPPHLENGSALSRGKTAHADWFEPSNSVSSSSGPQRRAPGNNLLGGDRRDRFKWHGGAEEEVKSGLHRASRHVEDGREGSLSPHRLRDKHISAATVKPPLHGQEMFARGSGGRGTMDTRVDRDRWRNTSQGVPNTFDGGHLDYHGPDESSPRDRTDRVRRLINMNRPAGSPMVRPQLASLPVPTLAPLPPPPPFRPGIDNPAVLGPPNGGYDDGSGSRDQGRGDRKGGPLRRGEGGGGIGPSEAWRGVGLGNWNSRNQGPLPGSGFPPFPPQFAPHPPGGSGFPGIGQQFPGPPIFPGAGGGRPPLELSFGGGRFIGPGNHMGEVGDGFHGHGRGTGWHGPGEVDDGRGPPLLGPGDGWDGPGPHGDDRHRHGRMEWDRVGPIGVRGWEREREREHWEGRGREGGSDYMQLRTQMEPPLQNLGYPPGGSAWGIHREPQVSNDGKLRPERPTQFDLPEGKRKADGGPPKLKAAKPIGRTVPMNENKPSKFATATMQTILSQLDISPELAGIEMFQQSRALFPGPDSGGGSISCAEDDEASDSADEDLILESVPEAEALISGPRLLSKLLPPLQESVFEAALALYRKPEAENRLQISFFGSFVLPFDPATVKMPSISMELGRGQPIAVQNPSLPNESLLVNPDVDAALQGNNFKSEEVTCNQELGEGAAMDSLQEVAEFAEREGEAIQEEYPTLSSQVEVAEFEDREGEVLQEEFLPGTGEVEVDEGPAVQEEFLPSHVEVAEYSDREVIDEDMEDTLEEDSLKEVQEGGPMVESTESLVEEKHSVIVDMLPGEREPEDFEMCREPQYSQACDDNLIVSSASLNGHVTLEGKDADDGRLPSNLQMDILNNGDVAMLPMLKDALVGDSALEDGESQVEFGPDLQSQECPVEAQQESLPEGKVGQESLRGRKGGGKGVSRVSQRRSKRRGSTH